MENNNNQTVSMQPAVQKRPVREMVLKFLKKFWPHIVVGVICFSLGIGVESLSVSHRMRNGFYGRPGMNRMMPGAPRNGQQNYNYGRRNYNRQLPNNGQNNGQNSNNGQNQGK